MAESNAKLAEIQADATKRSQVALAKAQELVLLAQRDQELARLARDEIAPQEIAKKRIEIAAEAEAEKRRREAQGEADAILAKFEAEAKGVQMVLEAKAEGYRKLIEACGQDAAVGPTLLLIEKLPELVAEQVKAIQNVKIDKITVWDRARGPMAGTRRASSSPESSGRCRVCTSLRARRASNCPRRWARSPSARTTPPTRTPRHNALMDPSRTPRAGACARSQPRAAAPPSTRHRARGGHPAQASGLRHPRRTRAPRRRRGRLSTARQR
jgi:hypothetical protein